MVQVVTISASLAALAAEPLKPAARVSGASPSERVARSSGAPRSSEGPAHPGPAAAVQSAAIAEFFLTAEKQAGNTYRRAHEEYLQALADYREDRSQGEEEDDA